MLSSKKYLSAAVMSLIVLVLLSACSQVDGASYQPVQNLPEGHSGEANTFESPHEPSNAHEETPEEKAIAFDSLVLFELTDEDLKKPVTEIPYYSHGNIGFITEQDVHSVAEGHSPWRGSPVHAADILTQNLIPEGTAVDQVSHQVIHVKNENQADELTVIDKMVPDLGTFTISMQYPQSSAGISFITKIVWQPADSEALHRLKERFTEPLAIYNLRDEEHVNKDVKSFPNYQNGRIWFSTDEDIRSLNEGHSPWRTIPDIVAESYTRNLIPGNISPDSVTYEIINEDKDVVTVAVVVPSFGTYEVVLLENLFKIITEISFQPE